MMQVSSENRVALARVLQRMFPSLQEGLLKNIVFLMLAVLNDHQRLETFVQTHTQMELDEIYDRIRRNDNGAESAGVMLQ